MIYRQYGWTTVVISETKVGCGPLPLGLCEQSPPTAPVTSVSDKKEGTTTEYSHSYGNIPTLLLPLLKAPGSTNTCLITDNSKDPAIRSRLCSTSCMGWEEWGASCVIYRWQGKSSSYLWLQRWAWPSTTRGLWTWGPSHLWRHHRGGHCDWTQPIFAHTPLGTCTPCHCHWQMLQVLPKSAWSSLPFPRAM